MSKLEKKYDVIVAGAGIAGISAAVKAGEMGASVLLAEQYGFVGGMATAGMVSPFMLNQVNGDPLTKGVFERLQLKMQKMNGMIDNGFYAYAFRLAAFEMLKEAGVTVLFGASVTGVERKDKRLTAVELSRSNETDLIEGDFFIDTTGDAQLLYLGDFPWTKGDEKTGKLQAMTLFFRMGGIDMNEALGYVKENKEDFFDWMEYDFNNDEIISVAGYFSNVKKAVKEKRLLPDVEYIFFTTLPDTGEGSFNTSNVRGLDGSSSFDLTKASMTGNLQVNQIVQLLTEEIPGFKNAYLMETGASIGIRETRRAIGEYVITGDDIRNGSKFDDVVARGSYGVDIHGDSDEENTMEYLEEGSWYDIPLRALIVKDADNLFAAGRCISSTREGQAAVRIMAISAGAGEACGAAAALAAREHMPVRDIDYDELKNFIKHNVE